MMWVYAITLFLSAALLFSVQPMVGKMILPHLGGVPAVWNTCMVFFQAALLAGYAYAHGTSRILSARRQAALHVLLLAVAAVCFPPLGDIVSDSPVRETAPALWLLGALTITIGAPFFVLAGSAPMLQRWFAATDHRHAGDPYFLYAASNTGSLLALAAYPVLIEPCLTLPQQTRAWQFAFFLLIAMTALITLSKKVSGLISEDVRKDSHPDPVLRSAENHPDTFSRSHPANARQRLAWLVLAAIPSSLMLGVTTHITTNIAAIPLLWVAPLGLYLLTFILVFARRQIITPTLMERLLPVTVLIMAPLFFVTLPALEGRLVIAHLAMFFIAAMVCHGRLARLRPHASHLTEYYLWLALGGVLGGLLNAIIAPALFNHVIEYPLMMAAACLARTSMATSTKSAREKPEPAPKRKIKSKAKSRHPEATQPATAAPASSLPPYLPTILMPLLILTAGLLTATLLQPTDYNGTWGGLAVICLIVLIATAITWNHAARFALSYAAALLVIAIYARIGEGRLLHVERNFFGVKRVLTTPDGLLHTLYHGTTVHGMQWRTENWSDEPLAYYHRTGPVGDVFRWYREHHTSPHVAAVGLGAGAVAAYAAPLDSFTYIEIDPAIARIARDERYFTFLAQAAGTHDILIGDGRIVLAAQQDHAYGLIFLDAYSSDAIPTHLLSREALAMYTSKLADGGILAFHISNRLMNLEPVLANLAADAGLVAWTRQEFPEQLTAQQHAFGATPAHVVVIARTEADLHELTELHNWRPAVADPAQPVWTDHYADVFTLLVKGPAPMQPSAANK